MNLICHAKPILFSKSIIFFVICCSSSQSILAQHSYGTMKGILSVAGEVDKQVVTAHSKRLEVTLDYERALFEMRLPVNSLHTGVDSLDNKLMNGKQRYITLKGELGIEFINTETHPPMHFDFRAILNHQVKDLNINGEGHLEHINEGKKIVCQLGLSFDLEPKDLGLSVFWEKKLRVHVRQTVLNRISEDH